MSGLERPPESAAPSSKPKAKPPANVSEEDRDELALLDGVFQRIKRSVPAAPYILSTPSLHPYTHYSKHEAQSWMMGHLFQRDEEHLQYRTYLFREPYQDCFVLQPGEEDQLEVERPKSQASNTPLQGPKKKITLSAYQSKKANGVITPGSKKLSPSLPPIKLSSSQSDGNKEPVKQGISSSQKQDEARSHKRPATETLLPEKPEKRAREDRRLPQSQPKIEFSDPKMGPDRAAPSNATPHGLPPLLSPVDQPLNNPYDLPAILSPTLPSNVQAELDRLETQRKRGDSNASTSSSDRKSQLLSVPDVRSQKVEEQPRSRIRSVSVNGKSPSSGFVSKEGSSGPSLVVKLKYGKQKVATIGQLLRLPPSRKPQIASEKKERQEAVAERPVKAQAKVTDGIPGKAKDTIRTASSRPEISTPPPAKTNSIRTSTKAAEKRPRSEGNSSQMTPAKRPRHSQDGPSTPSQQLIPSPAPSSKSSAQRGHAPFATPRKDHKAINMLRTNSTESYDSTPGPSGNTPSGSRQLDPKAAPTSVPLNPNSKADYQSLTQTSQKLNNLGRSLKHEAQKVITGKGSQPSKEDSKRAATTSLECLLSYMAAYAAQDQSNNLRGRPGDVEATWKTLWPLCMSYMKFTKGFPHLDGLRHYLTAVVCAAICAHVTHRATRQAQAHDSPQDAPASDTAKQSGQVNENFALLSEHYMHTFRATQDARMVLPSDDLQRLYPKTWAGKESNPKLLKASERFTGRNLSGPYFLPIQVDTSPIQAVRFGLKFLSEYCEKEKLDYTFRVNLEKPE